MFSALGLSILLNQQLISGDDIAWRAVQVTGVHISFSGFASPAFGLLNGEVYLAHAEASLNARPDALGVPEPALSALLGAAFAGLAFTSRRRRSSPRVD